MKQIKITLTDDEYNALFDVAKRELRTVNMQACYYLRNELSELVAKAQENKEEIKVLKKQLTKAQEQNKKYSDKILETENLVGRYRSELKQLSDEFNKFRETQGLQPFDYSKHINSNALSAQKS